MAVYNSKLKPNAFITVEDYAEWADIKMSMIQVPQAEVKASLVVQDLTYTSKENGIDGNEVSIEYVGGALAGAEIVTLTDHKITVQIEDGVSTAEQIKTALEGHAVISLFSVEYIVEEILDVGDVSFDPQQFVDELIVKARVQSVSSEQNLEGGLNDIPFEDDVEARIKRVEKVINTACDKIEKAIGGPVLAKQYQEDCDGQDSNMIVPSYYPIISVEEVKIDYNRLFDDTSIIEPESYVLQGEPDHRQSLDDPTRVLGSNISLRDDDDKNIVGRIFTGSSVSAIRVNYTAGWGKDLEDVPYDLKHAAVLVCEYYLAQRENRDLGVMSKSVKGQYYMKLKDGLPESVCELVDPYVDIGFGKSNKMQTNFFGL